MKMKHLPLSNSVKSSAVILALALAGMNTAVAGPILGATSAVINSGGAGFGSINDTFNQNGLSAGYVSGVTDFDTYIASAPSHTSTFSGFEWFSDAGTNSASVTYNLGVAHAIDAIALWNEEAAGIGVLDLFYSLDGVSFSALASGLLPTDNTPFPDPYFADVFSFAAVNAQYVRFDMSSCPQEPAGFTSCAIGEVAFREGQVNAVPLPSVLSLGLLGLAGMGYSRRAKKQVVTA